MYKSNVSVVRGNEDGNDLALAKIPKFPHALRYAARVVERTRPLDKSLWQI